MKITELEMSDDTLRFKPFAIRIEVMSRDELWALTHAVGEMCNGHGLDIYALLKKKCQLFNVGGAWDSA